MRKCRKDEERNRKREKDLKVEKRKLDKGGKKEHPCALERKVTRESRSDH